MKLINFLYTYVASLHRDTKGASAIEYAIIAGLIAAVLVAVLITLGQDLLAFFQSIVDTLAGP